MVKDNFHLIFPIVLNSFQIDIELLKHSHPLKTIEKCLNLLNSVRLAFCFLINLVSPLREREGQMRATNVYIKWICIVIYDSFSHT